MFVQDNILPNVIITKPSIYTCLEFSKVLKKMTSDFHLCIDFFLQEQFASKNWYILAGGKKVISPFPR